jgi:glycosyltransferase involved in cell wall biosynthesis
MSDAVRVAVLGIKHLPAEAGADRVVEQLLERLPKENSYAVYVMRSTRPAPVCHDSIRYVSVPALGGKHLRSFSYFLLCSLHVLMKSDYDVVHVHNSDFGLFCLPLKLRRRLRLVGTFHGNPYERAKWGQFAKLFLRFSEWCFARSCDVLTSVASTKTVSGRTVHHIPNGITRLQTAPGSERHTLDMLGVERHRYMMFACGRLDATKGLHHVLRAYRRIDAARAERLLVIGDFGHDSVYSRLIESEAGDDPRVILYRTLLDRQALGTAISGASVFVFPSEVEAMSMMLLEALGCGVPVVCSDIAENIAVVGPQHPFLFRSRDVEALTQALLRALAADDELHATENVEDSFSRLEWPSIAAAYARLY